MKRIVLIASLFALLLAGSCQKVNETVDSAIQPTETITFKCIFPEAYTDVTKVSMTDDGKVGWEVGDRILVHADGSSNRQIVELTAGDISLDKKVATISVAGVTALSGYPAYISRYYAAYPADDVPAGNLYYNTVFHNTNQYLLAACDNGDSVFEFFPQCGLITFIVHDDLQDFDEYVFLGNNDEVVGYDEYICRFANCWKNADDHSQGRADKREYARVTSDGGFSLIATKSVRATVADDGYTVNYLYIPGGVNLTKGFTIRFLKDGVAVKMVSTKTSYSVNIHPGEYLPLGDISSYLKDYSAPASHTAAHPSIEGATNLSSSGTANCYIVEGWDASNKDKVFKFKAVTGNNASAYLTNIASADVYWETFNTETSVKANQVIAQADYEKSGGEVWITFKMPSTLKAGNAVIVAKDGAENIIWSWHIWIPSQSFNAANTYGIYNKALMDRNLGALERTVTGSAAKVESFGLLYQWGRKDPFLGAKRNNSGSKALVAGAAPYATDGDGDGDDLSKITLAQSIAHPTLLGHRQGQDWVTPSDNTLWRDDAKTIYDPCPVGYRVPPYKDDQPLNSSDISSQAGWVDGDTSLKYFTLGSPDAAVFPYCGYYDDWGLPFGSSVASYGGRIAMWTSTYSSDSGKTAWLINVRGASAGNKHFVEATGKTRAGSIRCCVE